MGASSFSMSSSTNWRLTDLEYQQGISRNV
jgi:hypothetical protein